MIFHPPHLHHSGSLNMAIDQAIMEAVGTDSAPPTLRCYAWSPPCLSLGYAQTLEAVDQVRLAMLGWQIVRRPTGGKAILHTDELTYSLVAPEDHPIVHGGVIESYRRISAALLAGLTQLEVTANITPREMARRAEGPVCFEVPSDYEITAHGKKLIGSAQVRRQKTVLQHGTLPLVGDVARICDALVFADEQARTLARERVRQRATTLTEALGRSVEWSTVAEALQSAFARHFGLEMHTADLSAEEWARAQVLQTTVYQDTSWTAKQ